MCVTQIDLSECVVLKCSTVLDKGKLRENQIGDI